MAETKNIVVTEPDGTKCATGITLSNIPQNPADVTWTITPSTLDRITSLSLNPKDFKPDGQGNLVSLDGKIIVGRSHSELLAQRCGGHQLLHSHAGTDYYSVCGEPSCQQTPHVAGPRPSHDFQHSAIPQTCNLHPAPMSIRDEMRATIAALVSRICRLEGEVALLKPKT